MDKFRILLRKIVVVFIVAAVSFTVLPFSAQESYAASKTKNVSMTQYQAIKSGNTVYCVGGGGIYKVKVKKGKVVKVKRLVKTDMYSYVYSIAKKGNYLYYVLYSSGTWGCIERVNVKTGKVSKIKEVNELDGFAVSGKKVYYRCWTYTKKKTYSVNLDGSSKKAVKAVIKVNSKSSNDSKYSVITKYKGKYEKDYIKTPKGKKYLGKVKRWD